MGLSDADVASVSGVRLSLPSMRAGDEWEVLASWLEGLGGAPVG